ncbi:cytochrome c550 [Salirhabdus salicampi]|uniref:cytochrome c550 n=1 Tax=Salirhabdus salicampi TaxID=476102 RepID=UPI0020C28866|nr:cytochrome c [Salirhabdus salicampi]MCP8616889.1 cytochrome c [Salirhabdus salicampi]
MKKNPIMPFALIASLGIVAMIILASIGMNQVNEAKEDEGENGGNLAAPVTTDPEEIYANNCAMCHGADLSGGAGPALNDVGSRLSEDEIRDIIINGIPDTSMPGGLVGSDETEIISEWLAEKQ